MVVLITGCRSGFGLLFAVEAARAGHIVYAGLRDLSSEHQARLESLVSRYRAVGCPRNVAFTGLPQVLAALAATRVHEVEEESAQFALAVAVVPYPCEVFSVWVYAVALLPLAAS